MKPILLLALLSAATVNAQVISLTPSNYFLRIVTQNDVGQWRATWQESSVDTIVLSNRVLTFLRSVTFAGVANYGTALGGPNRITDSYSYRQVGAATYLPVGGEQVTFFAIKPDRTWIARTNYVLEADMDTVFFVPAFVGTLTVTDGHTRTITTGSSIILGARNLVNSPYLLQLPCEGSGSAFTLLFRFQPSERKQISLGTELHNVRWFLVDLENAGGMEL